MRQLVGWRDEERTVRDLLALALGAAGAAGRAPRSTRPRPRTTRDPSDRTGLALARAHAEWGDAGGWDAEVLWDTCTTLAMRQPFVAAGGRRLSTLSGGEQKRLALEVVLRSDADVLLLDEPDNYLDVAGKEWLEDALRDRARRRSCSSATTGRCSRGAADKVVTLEGRTAWTHGASFATWHEARDERLARIDEEHRRWQEERQRLERVAAGVPPPRRDGQRQVRVPRARRRSRRSNGSRRRRRPTASRSRRSRCGSAAIAPASASSSASSSSCTGSPIRSTPRSGSASGSRCSARTAPARATSCACSRASRSTHDGTWRLGARVVPGYFSQTHDQPELRGVAVLDVVMKAGHRPRAGDGGACAATGCTAARGQPFETLSGGQQARLQILLLELTGANLLLLDEPTDNLDLASAEALEEALDVVRRHRRRGDPRPLVPADVRPLPRVRPRLLGDRAPRTRLRVNVGT